MTTSAARVAAALGMVAFAAVGAVAVSRLRVASDLTFFLPNDSDRVLVDVTTALATSEAARTRTLLVRGRDDAATEAAADAIAGALRRRPEVEAVITGPPPGVEDALRRLYWPRRAYLLPEATELDDATLRARARALRRSLASPIGAGVAGLAREDPLGLFLGAVERWAVRPPGTMDSIGGRFVTRDGMLAVLVRTRASAFDGAAQGPLEDAIGTLLAGLRARDPRLVVRQAGAHRLTVRAERAMRADVAWVSVASTVGVLALLLLVLRSARPLVLAMIATGAGLATGLLVTELVLGHVHAITLAFGSSLVGVCVDYPIHLATHHMLGGPGPPGRALRRVLGGLLLGGGTTVAGVAALGATTMPGLREIALFSSVGVGVALFATCTIVPPWLGAVRPPPAALRRTSELLASALRGLASRRRLALAIVLVAVAVSGAGLARLSWADDPAALSGLDPALVAEDALVRARVTGLDTGRLVFTVGRDDAEALERSARVARVLDVERRAGRLAAYESVSALVPAQSAQRASAKHLWAPTLPARLDAAFVSEGFRPGAFTPLPAAYVGPSVPPLGLADVSRSALGDRVRPMRARVGGGVALLTMLGGVRDPDALRARVERVRGARLFDRQRFVASAIRAWRQRLLWLLGCGLVAAFVLALARYRRPRAAVVAVLPSVLAAATALGALGLLGIHANLMALVGLLLVLSMGVDYSVFVVEHRDHADAMPATLVGVLLASVTTVISFGLLAWSSSPALEVLGIVVGIGSALSFVLPAAALVLLEPNAGATRR